VARGFCSQKVWEALSVGFLKVNSSNTYIEFLISQIHHFHQVNGEQSCFINPLLTILISLDFIAAHCKDILHTV
jgi:hypothetical protein